jgi:hypothetical protein
MSNEVTYTDGFKMKMNRDLSRKDVAALCELLTIKLQEMYTTPPWYGLSARPSARPVQIVPEPITEGGLLFLGGSPDFSYAGEGTAYKTMRLSVSSRPGRPSARSWPYIHDRNSCVEDWKTSDEIIFFQHDTVCTFLKAFRGPVWTLHELRVFQECFEQFDIRVFTSSWPKKKDLRELW